jgi:hypothetical protein
MAPAASGHAAPRSHRRGFIRVPRWPGDKPSDKETPSDAAGFGLVPIKRGTVPRSAGRMARRHEQHRLPECQQNAALERWLRDGCASRRSIYPDDEIIGCPREPSAPNAPL